MKSTLRRLAFLLLVSLGLLPDLSLIPPTEAAHTTFVDGDLFVSISNGQVQWHHADGTLNRTLTTAAGGFTTGMAFDSAGNLYVTEWLAGGRYTKLTPR